MENEETAPQEQVESEHTDGARVVILVRGMCGIPCDLGGDSRQRRVDASPSYASLHPHMGVQVLIDPAVDKEDVLWLLLRIIEDTMLEWDRLVKAASMGPQIWREKWARLRELDHQCERIPGEIRSVRKELGLENDPFICILDREAIEDALSSTQLE
jgi:hypothetical protein